MLNLIQVSRDLAGRNHSSRARVQGFFADAAGRLYESNTVEIDIEHWQEFWNGRTEHAQVIDPLIVSAIRRLPRETTVVGANGEALGIVREVSDDYFFLHRGDTLPDLRIPGDWVAGHDRESQTLFLTVNADAFDASAALTSTVTNKNEGPDYVG